MTESDSIGQGWKRLGSAEGAAADSSGGASTGSDVSSAPRTFILSGAVFEGTLTLRGDFHIDTEFRGELETDGSITVGPLGSVVGGIRAREVVIQGAVMGNVHAPRQLIVEANGKLHGDIETACLEIQKHAFFQGQTTMTQPQASRRPSIEADPGSDSANAPL